MSILARITQNPELRQRILFTLGLLAVYRVGIFVPSPGVDRNVMQEVVSGGQGFLALFNLLSGGALEQMSIFALGIMPYISASIIIQMMGMMVPALERLKKEGEQGRRKITAYTRYLTIGLCLVQGVVMTRMLENFNDQNPGLINNSGFGFTVITIIALTTGTAFLMWLGEQITERGIGNGISLLITAGIVAGLPGGAIMLVQRVQRGELQPLSALLLVATMLVVVAAIVYVETAQRRIPVQYANRAVGQAVFAGEASYLPLKINITGVIPPIFASAMLMFPASIAGYFPESALAQQLQVAMNPLDWRYNVIYVALIVFFCFFYTSVVFNPVDIADGMKRSGSFVPGIRPGKATAEYIDRVVSLLTAGGAVYLAIVCVSPVVIMAAFNIDFFYGGTSLLICVSIGLDTVRQIEGYLITQRYDEVAAGAGGTKLRERVKLPTA